VRGAAGRFRSFEKISDLVRNRTSDLPACSIAPQPSTQVTKSTMYIFSILEKRMSPERFVDSISFVKILG
jgi:hypothetical protein